MPRSDIIEAAKHLCRSLDQLYNDKKAGAIEDLVLMSIVSCSISLAFRHTVLAKLETMLGTISEVVSNIR